MPNPLGVMPVGLAGWNSPFGAGLNPDGTPKAPAANPYGLLPTPPDLGPRPVAPEYPAAQINAQSQFAGQQMQNAAANTVNPYQIQGAQNTALGANAQAHLGALPTYNSADPRFNPQPYQPQVLPPHQFADLPTRPAPGHDPMSQGLGLLAGFVDPRGAGQYNAAPLQAGIDVANRQYQDRQTAFQQAQQQLDQQYQAQRAQVEAANSGALFNLQNQQRGTEELGRLRDQAAYAGAPLAGTVAGAQSLATTLGSFADSEHKKEAAEALLGQAGMNISNLQKGYEAQAQTFGHEIGPYLMGESRMFGSNVGAVSREAAAGERADATTGAAQIRAAASTSNNQNTNATKIKGIGMQQEGANARQTEQIQADAANGPTGAAAKDPATQNAFKLYQGFASDLAKTERILQQGWKTVGGANKDDMGAFSRWMHSDPVWQRQADTANKAYLDYLTKATNANTATPGTSGQTAPPSGNATRPGQPVTPPTSRYSAPPPNTPRVQIR